MKNQSSEQFYTWVDASGQIRTTQKPQNNKQKSIPEKPPATQIDESQQISESSNAVPFDTSEYRSSVDVDKQLTGTKMFSWQEDGRTITQESRVLPSDKKAAIPLTLVSSKLNLEVGDYSALIDQTIFTWENLKGSELDLFRAYEFNDKLNTDSILIELDRDVDVDVKTIIFHSYIKRSKMALPSVVFLSERFGSLRFPAVPFTHFIPESWSNYAHMQGVLVMPKHARYMLILPNPETGVIELEGKQVQLSDQGRIMFKPYLTASAQQ